jgi:hypothetical protein
MHAGTYRWVLREIYLYYHVENLHYKAFLKFFGIFDFND